MPSKEFWPLLCHPCSLMSSSRKQKDSPTKKKKWLWQSWDRSYEWFIYSLHPWCEKRKSLLWLNRQISAAAQLSTAAHCISVIPQPWMPMEAVNRKSYCSRKAVSKCLPAPSTQLPNISLGTSPFGGATPRAQNLFKQSQGVKQLVLQGSLTPLQGGCKLQQLAWMWEQNDPCIKGTP